MVAEFRRSDFGPLPDGHRVEAITLVNSQAVSVTVITYGAALQALLMPDRNGKFADVQLGFATVEDYLADDHYTGSTVGRVANRIAEGKFELDGKPYTLPVNNGPNSLHGGTCGFDKVLWEVVDVRSGERASVTMRHVSPDGDQGYPGTLTVLATYSLNEANELTIEYEASTDKPTIVALTNHAYWNLAGEGSPEGAMGHILTLTAAAYTPLDDRSIPTGEIRDVAGTVFDFRNPRIVGEGARDSTDAQIAIARGYDHNFVFANDVPDRPFLMARMEDPVSGRGFELRSNQRGMHLYSGHYLDGRAFGKSRHAYRPGDAIALEPQAFPDTANQAGFGSIRLAPDETYRSIIIYRLFAGNQPAA